MSLPPRRIAPSVGSIRRNTVRPTVDLPQPDSPTSPRVSPSRIEKLTPSTANTVPPARCIRPLCSGKCFFNPLTSSTGAPFLASGALIAVSIEFVRAPAGGPVARPLLLVIRIAFAAEFDRMLAARREHASGRQIGQGRHGAGNLLQALDRGRLLSAHQRQFRNRGHQPVRIGMLRAR